MSNFNLLISRSSVLLLALAAVFTTVESKELEAQETDGNTTIEELSEEKNNTLGKKVTVRGEVGEVDPGVSFAIEEDGFLEGDKVLVINRRQSCPRECRRFRATSHRKVRNFGSS